MSVNFIEPTRRNCGISSPAGPMPLSIVFALILERVLDSPSLMQDALMPWKGKPSIPLKPEFLGIIPPSFITSAPAACFPRRETSDAK